jgi:hypothetical protein
MISVAFDVEGHAVCCLLTSRAIALGNEARPFKDGTTHVVPRRHDRATVVNQGSYISSILISKFLDSFPVELIASPKRWIIKKSSLNTSFLNSRGLLRKDHRGINL